MRQYLGLGKLVTLAWIVVFIFMVSQAISVYRDIEQDMGGYLARADAATTAEQMAGFIDNAMDGLNKWGMYEGSWGLIVKDPNTRMELARTQLVDLQDRLLEVERTENRGSMGYAESMEEVKRNFSRIAISPYEWYTLRHAIYLYPEIFAVILFVGSVLCFLIAVLTWGTWIIPAHYVCKIKGHEWCQGCNYKGEPYKGVPPYCERCRARKEQPEKESLEP